MDTDGGIMRKKVFVRGPALSASGYGEHTRLVLRALRSREDIFDIFLEDIPWGHTGQTLELGEESEWMRGLVSKGSQSKERKESHDISLQVTIPNEFQKIASVNIGITAGIETNKVAPEWIQKCNEMDKIITISEHSKKGFTETKYPLVNQNQEHVADLECKVPVEIVGYPVKELEPADIEYKFETDFNFLTIALWGQRKNIEQTILSFVEAFRDNANVGLVLKTGFINSSTKDKIKMKEALSSISSRLGERKCKIYLLHGRLTESEMTTLLRHDKIKCMLSLAHGEGYGLPLFEAAYNGLPVISTDWGGQLDFLYMPETNKKGKTKNKGMFGKVSYELRPVQRESVWQSVITPDSKWAYPSKQSAKTKMNDVYKDYNLALSKAGKLKEHVLKEFSEQKIHEKMVESVYPERERKFQEDINSMFSELNL
jgi:hypothetical protein